MVLASPTSGPSAQRQPTPAGDDHRPEPRSPTTIAYLARTPAKVAARKALEQGRTAGVEEIDLWEINEAFASVTLNSMRMLGIDEEKRQCQRRRGRPRPSDRRLRGSHPRFPRVLELRRRGGGLGCAAICSGGGQGDAVIVEVQCRLTRIRLRRDRQASRPSPPPGGISPQEITPADPAPAADPERIPPGESLVSGSAPGGSAVFFDLDKTLMEGSSAFQFGRAARRVGLISSAASCSPTHWPTSASGCGGRPMSDSLALRDRISASLAGTRVRRPRNASDRAGSGEASCPASLSGDALAWPTATRTPDAGSSSSPPHRLELAEMLAAVLAFDGANRLPLFGDVDRWCLHRRLQRAEFVYRSR